MVKNTEDPSSSERSLEASVVWYCLHDVSASHCLSALCPLTSVWQSSPSPLPVVCVCHEALYPSSPSQTLSAPLPASAAILSLDVWAQIPIGGGHVWPGFSCRVKLSLGELPGLGNDTSGQDPFPTPGQCRGPWAILGDRVALPGVLLIMLSLSPSGYRSHFTAEAAEAMRRTWPNTA